MPISLKRALSSRSSSKSAAAVSAPASDGAQPLPDADAEALRKETLAAEAAAEVCLARWRCLACASDTASLRLRKRPLLRRPRPSPMPCRRTPSECAASRLRPAPSLHYGSANIQAAADEAAAYGAAEQAEHEQDSEALRAEAEQKAVAAATAAAAVSENDAKAAKKKGERCDAFGGRPSRVSPPTSRGAARASEAPAPTPRSRRAGELRGPHRAAGQAAAVPAAAPYPARQADGR